jgi:hypothetical protein
MRTTIDIDDPILCEVKELQKIQRKSLGRLVSDLLAQALREGRDPRAPSKPPRWISKGMQARINLNDKEALYSLLDNPHSEKKE